MEQNLSQYKIFYEVAKAGNISRAAKELYISQPAISKSISKLEDSLGFPSSPEAPGASSSPARARFSLSMCGRHLRRWTGANRR